MLSEVRLLARPDSCSPIDGLVRSQCPANLRYVRVSRLARRSAYAVFGTKVLTVNLPREQRLLGLRPSIWCVLASASNGMGFDGCLSGSVAGPASRSIRPQAPMAVHERTSSRRRWLPSIPKAGALLHRRSYRGRMIRPVEDGVRVLLPAGCQESCAVWTLRGARVVLAQALAEVLLARGSAARRWPVRANADVQQRLPWWRQRPVTSMRVGRVRNHQP